MKLDYTLSLPERLVRIAAAGLGGLVYQISMILLPGWIRQSRLYRATVGRLLRIIIELLGGVQGAFPTEDMPVRELAARKAAGNAVEVLSFVAVGWSPVWLLAAAADVMGGTQVYLRTLVEDLQQEGALPPDTQVNSVEGLLNSLEGTLGQAADTVDMPPLNLEDMRQSWRELQERASRLPDADTLADIYEDLRRVSNQEGQSIYRTSSLIAQGAVRTGIKMGNVHVFDYYRDALDSIAAEGLGRYIQRISAPYLQTIVHHLAPGHKTHTERFLQGRRPKRGSSVGDSTDE
jgi:hypothetical protein